MTLSRRDFASLVASALGGLALPGVLRASHPPFRDVGIHPGAAAAGVRRPRAQETFFQWERVTDRVRVALGGGGNTILYLADRGSLQSDGKNFGLGRTLRREAEAFGVPVTHFVNTHHHGDHSGGNDGFAHALRFAHVNAEPRIRDSAEASLRQGSERLGGLLDQLRSQSAPGEMLAEVEAMLQAVSEMTPADFAPERTFQGIHEVEMEGRPVLLRWVSRGHTDGDAFVFLPEENVLHAGDLLFSGRHPFVDDSARATPMGWVRCLDAMLELCDADTVVVPGHGPVGDRNALAAQRDYFLRLQQLVGDGLARGLSRDQVTALAPRELAELPGAERHLPRNLGIVMDEMTG